MSLRRDDWESSREMGSPSCEGREEFSNDVWLGESLPYSILSQAFEPEGTNLCAGVNREYDRHKKGETYIICKSVH